MPSRYYSAIAQDTTLASGITNAANSMTVSALVGFPASFPYVVAVDYNAASEELILVTNAVGTTLTITRGFNGSTAVAHSTGAVVRHVIVAQDLTDAQAHYDATTSVHGITDTSTLVTTSGSQTLTNKTINAANNTLTGVVTTLNLTLNAQTGTTYTLASTDVNKLVTLSNAAAITVTIPAGTFTTGQQINLQQIGAGQVTIQGDGTTTFTGTGTKLRAQYSAATLVCTASNTFTLIGDIV